MTTKINVAAVGFFISAVISAPSWAVDLKVTGEDGSQLAVFDQASIEALGLIEIKTETPWTEGVVRFQGASVASMLSELNISDASVTGHAVNDYAVSLNAEIIEKYNPIIATRMNGKAMTIEGKGPFWIVFDFDEIGEDHSVELYSLSVWYLVELEVE